MNFTEDSDPIRDMKIGDLKHLIEEWLESFDVDNYRLTKKYAINVYTSVMLDNKNLMKFPDYVKFNHIVGGFHAKGNNLKNLRGGPFSVTGSFIVSNNKLENLLNGPFIVKESYGASNNMLETLKGMSEIIEGSIYINNNKLKNLEYIPTIIKGDFYIQENPIETLQYFPIEIEGNLYFTPSNILTKESISKKCKVWGHIIEK